MPIIKSAKKKMRKDKVRTAHNFKIKENIKRLVKVVRHDFDAASYHELTSRLDKAVKTKLIHKNKAARLKSRLSKGLAAKTASKPAK